jgi:hypothetical protein
LENKNSLKAFLNSSRACHHRYSWSSQEEGKEGAEKKFEAIMVENLNSV